MIISLLKPREVLRQNIVGDSGLNRITAYPPEDFGATLKQFQPQLLHAHFATDPAATARTLARRLDVPFTFTAHGYDIYYRPPADFSERASAAALIATVSKANQRHIVRTFGVAEEHIRVVPNGVDTDLFKPASRSDNPPGAPPLMVCIARHHPVKNLPLLLEACAILRGRGIGFRSVMIGDGSERGMLEDLRRRLAIDHLVEMTGEITRRAVQRWLHRASVAVLCSESEGMPISLIEAAACAVPAVATCVGGIPELVEDGVTGLLTRPNDAMSLADALAQILTNPLRAAAMGAAARRRAVERFSLRAQVDRLIEMWQEVLERPESARTLERDLTG
jgi:glycosyltransferase involved in cell wall biosynthesis